MLVCYKNGLPQVIIDAIDAAYVAGVDDSNTEKAMMELLVDSETLATAQEIRHLIKSKFL